ncbi:MAG: LysR family transcriptional regulator [Anaerolineales bacterium]
MDTEKIQTFLHAAENLSFSEAAKLLHLSQPSVSHQIKTLEQELGVSLFSRSSTGLELTESGRVLLPWARRLIHDAASLKELMISLEDEVVGELRISCSTTAGKYVLPQIVARFCSRYPGIHARILTCRPERATLDLMEGEAHIGVVSSELNDPNFESQHFFDDHVLLIAPAGHPWAKRSSIEPHELLDEPLILREPESGTRRSVLAELAAHDIALEDLRILMELGNAEAIVSTVAAGYGVSFVSALAAVDQIKQGTIVSVAVDELTLLRNVYMIRKKMSPPHRPRDVFWSFVHAPENADLLSLPEQLSLA